MRDNDPFGLRAEQLIVESGVREVFTPHQPVATKDLLMGREGAVRGIVSTGNTPGQHALLYGDRGIGKSSVGNIVSGLMQTVRRDGHFIKRCDSLDTFDTLVYAPLCRDQLIPPSEVAYRASSAKNVGARVGITGGYESGHETTTRFVGRSLSPSYVAELLRDHKGSLLIDEIDSLSDKEDWKRLAELIKHLSDSSSQFKIFVVALPGDGLELLKQHASVRRCLRETKLDRLTESDLAKIVTEGGRHVGLSYEESAVHLIAELSNGFPEFTHLLALKSAEHVIPGGSRAVTEPDVRAVLKLAAADAGVSLRETYESATRSTTDVYRQVLMAAATIDSTSFTTQELRDAVASLWTESFYVSSLNAYIPRLIGSDDDDKVLRRIKNGVYQFRDPRMPSFVRMENEMAPQDRGRHRAL